MAVTNPTKARIGMMGLGVMGSNLALNIERNGFPVAVWERLPDLLNKFLETQAVGRHIIGAAAVKEFAQAIERPRPIVLLVAAGDPVDWTIQQVKPFLDPGDILIDAGNSHFKDTIRRQEQLAKEGLHFIGNGTSGGAEGALHGPSLMPGGPAHAYSQIKEIWEAIAAKVDDGPCVTYIGPDGAGHFVKMVHNGIEYGDMQLIAEAYDILRKILGMRSEEMGAIFEQWNEGLLNSYLIEITAKVLSFIDKETSRPLVELIVDKAGQKGTGRWTSELALDLGIPIPTIDAALVARGLSQLKDQRVAASAVLSGPLAGKYQGDASELVGLVRDALYAAKICSYAQGFSLIQHASLTYKWGINLSELARIWKGGCIIRARFLNDVKAAYARNPELPNLLLDPDFGGWIAANQERWRRAVGVAQTFGVPVPAFSASLAYFDSYRSSQLPQNLTQAQRDFFGAHTYERVDRPDAGFIHTEWEVITG